MNKKQRKACETCGKMQSIQDNEKILQTHTESKLHTGYLKNSEYIFLHAEKKEIRQKKNRWEKALKMMQKIIKEKEKIREKENIKKKTI